MSGSRSGELEEDDVDLAEYLGVAAAKHAALTACACELGALAAGASRSQADHLREFGDDVDALRIDRRAQRILTFGYGAHHCLGAAAARLMGRVVLEELLERCPDYAVDGDAATFAPGHFVRWYDSLPFAPEG